jgi:hypothetical protein
VPLSIYTVERRCGCPFTLSSLSSAPCRHRLRRPVIRTQEPAAPGQNAKSRLIAGGYRFSRWIGARLEPVQAMMLSTLVAAVGFGLSIQGSPAAATAPALAAAVESFTASHHEQAAVKQSDAPIRVDAIGRTVVIPRDCGGQDGSYDLLVHFHGIQTVVIPAFFDAGLKAVLVVSNLGEFSAPYEDKYQEPGSLTRLLDTVQSIVAKHCPAQKLGRVALSAWSGGYGAVVRIMARQSEADRVDAVLLTDGLHAGVKAPNRQVNPLQMEGILRFSEKAAAGLKLLGITHTEIQTSYASTTETADYLLAKNDVERERTNVREDFHSMNLTSTAHKGGFQVYGYAGNDKKAHCDHLQGIGHTLFPVLRKFWQRSSDESQVATAPTPASEDKSAATMPAKPDSESFAERPTRTFPDEDVAFVAPASVEHRPLPKRDEPTNGGSCPAVEAPMRRLPWLRIASV